jgi:hypothetical protein
MPAEDATLPHFPITPNLSLSSPGSTGQSSTPALCLLDRPVEPGDDSVVCVNPTEKRSNIANIDSRPKPDIVHGQANVDRTARPGASRSQSIIDAGTGNAILNHKVFAGHCR